MTLSRLGVTQPAALFPYEGPTDRELFLAQEVGKHASKPTTHVDGLGTLVQALSAAAPDGLVYSNAALLAPADTKTFVIVNPATRSFTHFVSRPGRRINVGGVPFSHVETKHYDFSGKGTRREDGFGYSLKVGQGEGQVTLFINGRLGDSNLLKHPISAITVNAGVFGSPSAIGRFIASLPSGGAKVEAIKKMVDRLIQGSSAGGTQLGFAWRAGLQLNQKTGELELNISGLKIPLTTLGANSSLVQANSAARNYAAKSVARVNNEEAYLKGANPFDHALNTRSPTGQFLNHGDPVAALAGDILWLQRQIDGPATPFLRSNDEARRLIERALDHRTSLTPEVARRYQALGIEGLEVHQNSMAPAAAKKLNGLLVQLYRFGLFFGSKKIEEASREAARSKHPAALDPEERAFLRKVFEGQFRYSHVRGYNAGDLSRDFLLGINRYLAIATVLFEPTRLARDEDILESGRNTLKGFQARLERSGGALGLLGLRAPANENASAYELKVTQLLLYHLTSKLNLRGKSTTADALFGEVMRLDPQARKNIGRWISARLAAGRP
jgi:hypothetical protein